MDQAKYEQLLFEFLASGHGFFKWFQGKNTPNILMMMTEQLGAIELALKSSGRHPTIKEFTYLSESELSDLWATVQRHIAEGWQPFGSLVVGNAEGHTKYFQAMAKFQSEAISPQTPTAQ